MARKLKDYQQKQVLDWVEKFSANKIIVFNKLHRDFSDGVAVAKILKEIFPKLIDLHNYTPSSSVRLKRSNWETLNHKVFKKLNIEQSSTVLDLISKSESGYIEKILFDIMRCENSTNNCAETQCEDDLAFAVNDDILMVNIDKKIGDAFVQVPQKMILYSIYEHTLKESREKDTIIFALSQKVTHLENVIELKTERIEELCGQLAKLTIHSNEEKPKFDI